MFAFLAAGALLPLWAIELPRPFAVPVRGVAYPARSASLPAATCLYARDLPLIALMGANTIRTYGMVPENDRTFTAVLESTGLNWLAGFPLDSFYDPTKTLGSQHDRILDAFKGYAQRFRGQGRLIGYILGEDVTVGYERKFAGSPADYYRLLEAAAVALTEIEPERTLPLGAGVTDPGDLTLQVRGLAFWSWNAGSQPVEESLRYASRPVILSEEGGRNADREFGPILAGGVYASYADQGDGALLRAEATGREGLDTLTARMLFYRLAGLWGGTFPAVWREAHPPRLASPQGTVSPGAVVRLAGLTLLQAAVPYEDESWPYYMAGSCLCVGTAPARLSFVAEGAVTVQIPSGAATGALPLVFYRAGEASNFVQLQVSEASTATLAGPVIEARLHSR